MATPNYQFEKRRRELDKQKKKAEKLQKKARGEPDTDAVDAAPVPAVQTPVPDPK